MKTFSLAILLCASTLAQKAPNNCFAESRDSFGVPGTNDFSNKEQIASDVNVNHRLSTLTACRTSGKSLHRLTLALADTKTGKTLQLASIGKDLDREDCRTINVDPADSITFLEVNYDSKGVAGVTVGTNQGQEFLLGSTASVTKSFKFTQSTKLIGFYGQTNSYDIITSLGAIVYFPNCYQASLQGNQGGGDQVSTTGSESELSGGSQQQSDSNKADEQFQAQGDLITDPDELSAQFINYKPEGNSREQASGQVTDGQEAVAEEESSSMLPIIIGAGVVVLIIILCVVCCLRAKGKKKNSIETEKSFQGTEVPTNRHMLDTIDEENMPREQKDGGVVPLAAVRMPSNCEISVEEQGEPDQKNLDIDQKSMPEVNHPQCVPAIDHGVMAETARPGRLQEESLHPPVEQCFVEEESSVAVINLQANQGSNQKTDQGPNAGSMLPAIEKPKVGSFFADNTPDTAGMNKRRFQEIIDSDDETNGNGSRVQRVQKKFKNDRDTFGGEDISTGRIDFPISENEGGGKNQEGELKLKKNVRTIKEEDEDDLTSGQNTAKAATKTSSNQAVQEKDTLAKAKGNKGKGKK